MLENTVKDHGNDTIYIFGHSKVGERLTGSGKDLLELRDYFTAMLAFTRKAIASGVPVAEVMKAPAIPGFERYGKRDITVRHLLTHTGGFPSLEGGFRSLAAGGWRMHYSTAQMFKSAVQDPVSFTPGERYQYSDVGYFLLGMVVAVAAYISGAVVSSLVGGAV